MANNPYAPPKAAVVDVPRLPTALKQRSVLVMIALFVVTFGLYYVIWFFRRRSALNSLNSPRELRLWPLIAFTAVWVGNFLINFGIGIGAFEQTESVAAALTVLAIARLAVGLVMVFQGFIIKDILEDHLAVPDDGERLFQIERVKLSGLMTFFFSIFYLQYVINRHIVGSHKLTL